MTLPPYLLATWPLCAAYAAMLAGMLLIIFRPFFPGVGLVAAAVLAYDGYGLYLLGTASTREIVLFTLIACLTFAGLMTSWWTEKLGIHYTYVKPELVWGGFLGMILFAILNMPLFGQIVGLFLGAIAAAIGVEKRPFLDALRHGPIAIYCMLGPRGFQLLMALLVADLATPLPFLPVKL